MKKLVFGLFFGLCLITGVMGQVKIGENPQNIHTNSVLELESTSKAFVITRINTTQMNAMTPLYGALIYNIDTACVHYFNGTIWINLCEAENAGDIGLEDHGDNTYTFTNADGAETNFAIPTFTSNYTGPFGLPVSGIKLTKTAPYSVNIEVDRIHGLSILERSITRNRIASDAIGKDELGETSVENIHLTEFAVTPNKIQFGASNEILKTNAAGTNVEWGLLDAANITGQDLTVDDASILLSGATPGVGALLEAVGISVADGGIINSKLAVDAVTTDKIADATIATADVADGAITNVKLDKTNIPLSGFADAATDVSLGSNKLINVVDPTDAQDAATKNYIDNQITTINTVTDGNILIGDASNSAA
ncbi:hypothetical protein MWU65_14865, partial [Cellulophaga sp. F20128]|nr:hypothetical protein [Cellulophaga sp. F20128]